jgi:hypothetical protein
MSSDRIGAEACADNIDSDHFHSAIWVPGSLDSGAKPLAQIDSRQAAGCGGGFLTSSWQESRGSIGVSAPACTTKVVCEPRRGLPLHYRSGRVYRPDARTAMEALRDIIRANDDPSWG